MGQKKKLFCEYSHNDLMLRQQFFRKYTPWGAKDQTCTRWRLMYRVNDKKSLENSGTLSFSTIYHKQTQRIQN